MLWNYNQAACMTNFDMTPTDVTHLDMTYFGIHDQLRQYAHGRDVLRHDALRLDKLSY